MRTRFGDFVLDDGARQLARAGVPVHLTPKAYALLAYLVHQGRRAVSKGEILEHLWPATFVSGAALTSVVKEVRHALGDSARTQRFIRGVRCFGYSFCAECLPLAESEPDGKTLCPPGCEFRVLWQHRELTLAPGENLLGRTHEAVVWVDDASVSRRHALIRVTGRHATIEDCGSRNGTFARGGRVEGRQELVPGEQFWLGNACLALVFYEGESTTAVPTMAVAGSAPAGAGDS
jgi:DNA-binding winged helix-turn-helix (wHTH) protein